MHRRIQRILFAHLAFAGLSIAAGTVADAEESPNVAEIVKHLRDWRRQFATVRVRWHSWNRQDFIDANPGVDPDQALGETNYSDYEFVWSDIGAIREERKLIKKQRLVHRDLFGTNGPRPWGAATKINGNPDELDLITFYVPDSARPLSTKMAFVGIYGLWNSSGEWIDRKFEAAIPQLSAQFDDLAGLRCPRLTLKTESETQKSEEIIWLDPNHYLPRKCSVSGELPNQGWTKLFTWIASDFEQHDRAIWWPMNGVFLEGDRQEGFEWHVKKVTFNESLPPSFFAAPEGTPGKTRIIDYLNRKVARSGSTSKGFRPTAASPTRSGASPQANPLQAVAPSSRWIWLLTAGFVLLIGGLSLRFCRRRNSD